MDFKNYNNVKIAFLSLFAVGFTSCGSYQYAGTDNDGIYSSERSVEYVEVENNRQVPQDDNSSSYYSNYFKEKSMEMDAMAQEAEIFTDPDEYSSEDYVEQDSLDNNYRGYAGWGQANEDVTINVYSGWNTGWGYGYGWNRPWRYNNWGWNSWYWNTGWGYGGFYDPYWGNPYYGYGYYNPYWYGGYYGNPYYNGYHGNYYGRRGVAYNAGRRGSARLYDGNITRRSALSTSSRSRNSTIRNNRSTRRNTVRTRSNTPRRSTRVRTTRSTRNNSYTTPRRTTRSNSVRSSSPRRSSTTSSSSSRSSRSSGSSSTSSRRGGGRR